MILNFIESMSYMPYISIRIQSRDDSDEIIDDKFLWYDQKKGKYCFTNAGYEQYYQSEKAEEIMKYYIIKKLGLISVRTYSPYQPNRSQVKIEELSKLGVEFETAYNKTKKVSEEQFIAMMKELSLVNKQM